MRWVAGLVLLAATGGAGYAGGLLYREPGPQAVIQAVVVPRTSLGRIADLLGNDGVVSQPWALRVLGWLTVWQGPIRAAELAFPAHASIEQVLLILRHGHPVQHLLTVPEGVTAARVAWLLAASPGLSGDIVVPAEGRFLPETYAYERGMSAQSVVARAAVAMTRLVNDAWDGRAPGLPLRSRRELLILASMVERETHLPTERPVVAAVFLNRLRLGMRLQSDPTAAYAASGGAESLAHGLRRDELDAPSLYNTYTVAGLPAGAICNPGAASILAVTHPAASDTLYFVADGSGGHVFARSLEEHARNVARVRAAARANPP